MAGAERKAVALSLEQEKADMLYILTDSQAALHTALNLSQGAPPRSGVEKDLKKALWNRKDQDTAITWIRSHTVYSRYKHMVGTGGGMLITNICVPAQSSTGTFDQ